MKKSIRIVFLFVVIISIFLISNLNCSYAKVLVDGNIDAIDYEVLIKKNSDVVVSEIWELTLDTTVDSVEKEFDDNIVIKDVLVTEYDKDGNKKNDLTKTEGISIDPSSYSVVKQAENRYKVVVRTEKVHEGKIYFLFTYTIENAVNFYNDCAEININLQNDKFNFLTKEISGRIMFESEPTSLDNINVWIHSNTDSEFTMKSIEKINYYIDGNKNRENVSIRVTCPIELFETENIDAVLENKLQDILEEEKNYVNNKLEMAKRDLIVNIVLLVIGVILIIILIVVIIIKKVKKSKIEPVKEENEMKENDIDKTE